MDSIYALWQQMLSQFSNNSIAAGVVSAGIVGGFIAGALVFLKQLPGRIHNLVVNQMTTSVTVLTDDWRSNIAFQAFGVWYSATKWSRYSRRLRLSGERVDLDSSKDDSYHLGPGNGFHFFWFKGRLYWFNKSVEDNKSYQRIENLTINTFGRSRAPLETLIEHFLPKPKEEGLMGIYQLNGRDGWARTGLVPRRPLESVITNVGLKEALLKQLDDFYNDRQWYLDNDLPHKLSLLLHGVPGTGKTSLIKALAAHFDADLYLLNLSAIGDETLSLALNTIPKGNFLIMEDVDSADATHKRKGLAAITNAPRNDEPSAKAPDSPAAPALSSNKKDDGDDTQSFSFMSMLSLTGFLNALDGVQTLDNIVIAMTTNAFGSLDPAVTREGRTDLVLEVKPLTNAAIREYYVRAYGDASQLNGHFFQELPGCKLLGLLLKHKRNSEGFAKDLIELYSVQPDTQAFAVPVEKPGHEYLSGESTKDSSEPSPSNWHITPLPIVRALAERREAEANLPPANVMDTGAANAVMPPRITEEMAKQFSGLQSAQSEPISDFVREWNENRSAAVVVPAPITQETVIKVGALVVSAENAAMPPTSLEEMVQRHLSAQPPGNIAGDAQPDYSRPSLAELMSSASAPKRRVPE